MSQDERVSIVLVDSNGDEIDTWSFRTVAAPVPAVGDVIAAYGKSDAPVRYRITHREFGMTKYYEYPDGTRIWRRGGPEAWVTLTGEKVVDDD